MKNEIPDQTIDDDERSAPASEYAGPFHGDSDDEYLLNDIGLAMRLRGEEIH